MVTANGQLDNFYDSYLEFLEGESPHAPDPAELPCEVRANAKAFVESITAAREIDPYAVAPTVDHLLSPKRS